MTGRGAIPAIVEQARARSPRVVSYSDPIPFGWRVVRYIITTDEVEIAPAWYAPPLRFAWWLRAHALWFRSGGGFVRQWWSRRPRI